MGKSVLWRSESHSVFSLDNILRFLTDCYNFSFFHSKTRIIKIKDLVRHHFCIWLWNCTYCRYLMVFREPLMFPNCINFAETVKYKCEGNKTIVLFQLSFQTHRFGFMSLTYFKEELWASGWFFCLHFSADKEVTERDACCVWLDNCT